MKRKLTTYRLLDDAGKTQCRAVALRKKRGECVEFPEHTGETCVVTHVAIGGRIIPLNHSVAIGFGLFMQPMFPRLHLK